MPKQFGEAIHEVKLFYEPTCGLGGGRPRDNTR
jgi:hypothetical protein